MEEISRTSPPPATKLEIPDGCHGRREGAGVRSLPTSAHCRAWGIRPSGRGVSALIGGDDVDDRSPGCRSAILESRELPVRKRPVDVEESWKLGATVLSQLVY